MGLDVDILTEPKRPVNPNAHFRLVFAGGGTGGHLAPGMAIADELVRRQKCDITFCTTGKAVEEKILGSSPYARVKVPAAPPSKSPLAMAKFVVATVLGIFAAAKLLREKRPHAVVALGGYGALPVALMAKIFGVKLFVCEQNTVAGRATRFLSRWAEACFTQWPLPDFMLHEKCRQIVIGNPTRRAIFNGQREALLKALNFRADRRTVLVMGGSQGAEAINRWLVGNRKLIGSYRESVQMIVLTGAKSFAATSAAFKHMENVRVLEFAANMGDFLAAADLVVGRAGATSISECTALGKAMVLIPYPQAKDAHQLKNALYVSRHGAALVYDQEFLDTEKMQVMVDSLLLDDWNRFALADASAALGRPDAGEWAARQILKLAGESVVKKVHTQKWLAARPGLTFGLSALKVEGIVVGTPDHPLETAAALELPERRAAGVAAA